MPFPLGIEALTPLIPVDGLVETTRSWSSSGQLFEALAAADEPGRQWTAEDVERRAHRVLAQELLPELVRWPRTIDQWLDALPAESRHAVEVTTSPTSGTSWRETARGQGWPPREFHGRVRHRVASTLLVSSLRWTLEALLPVLTDGKRVLSTLLTEVEEQAAVAGELIEVDPVVRAQPIEPGLSDLSSIASEGYPWNALAPVTRALLAARRDRVLELIDTLIVPDEDLRGQLFHLGVLGELLLSLRAADATVVPVRPISGAASIGPAYHITDSADAAWDLWFEGAPLWKYRHVTSPYQTASRGVAGAGGLLGADLLLANDSRALLIECKYSSKPGRVARAGFHQAAAYGLEARELFDEVISVVIGPSDVVQESFLAKTETADIGIYRTEDLGKLLQLTGVA